MTSSNIPGDLGYSGDPAGRPDEADSDAGNEFIGDPEAAEQATRDRMNQQTELEREEGHPVSSDPDESLDGPVSARAAGMQDADQDAPADNSATDSAGAHAAESGSYSPDSVGTPAAEDYSSADSVGSHSADSVGSESVDSQSLGSHSAGSESVGSHSAGSESVGSESVGSGDTAGGEYTDSDLGGQTGGRPTLVSSPDPTSPDPSGVPNEYPGSRPDAAPSGVPAPDPGGQPVPDVPNVPGVTPDPGNVPGDPTAPGERLPSQEPRG